MNQTAENFTTPLITPIAPANEQEHVNSILNTVNTHIGFIPDGLRLFSLSPPLLESFVSNISYFNGATSVPPSLMAMIRYLVSSKANCTFCIDMNEGFLANMGVDLEQVRAARSNPELAPVNDKERALMLLALKSVESPEGITAIDIKSVRDHGWSDREIFDVIVQANNNRAFNNILRTFNIEHQGVYS